MSSPIANGRFLAPCPHAPLLTFPDHPLSHPCQASPSLNVANFRSMKCTIYHADKIKPMCTLRRGWSLFNETACLGSSRAARESSDTQQPLRKRNHSCYAQPPTLNMHCWCDHYSKMSTSKTMVLAPAIQWQRWPQDQPMPHKSTTKVPGTTPAEIFRQPRSRGPAPAKKNDEACPTGHFGITCSCLFQNFFITFS